MKLNQEQLLQQNCRVLVKRSNKDKLRLLKTVESVDTDKKLISYWTVPVASQEVLNQKQPLTTKIINTEIPEVDNFLELKTETVDTIIVLDHDGNTLASTQ